MGNVRTSITHLNVLVCSAACLWGGLWVTACGSTKSGVNDETSDTSPSSDGTSNTDGAQSSTSSNADGAASNTASSGASGTSAIGSSGSAGTSNNATSDAGVGGSASSGTSTGSGGSTGTTATTMGGSAGSGGSAAGGTTATAAGGDGGSGGSGGSAATNGGSAGTGGTPSDCGPITFGGPREGGPQSISETCAQIDDEVIVDRYDDPEAKVPRGLYYEEPGGVSWWEEPCSESVEDTVDRIGDRAIGEIQSEVGTDWSYTVVGCSDGDHRFYNNLRCDYFDGSTLDGSTSEDLAFLASLLWWMERGSLTGAQILGYTASAGGATDTVTMCTIRTSFGDFGLCDQITLEQTQYSITVTGSVTIGDPETIRTIQGHCN